MNDRFKNLILTIFNQTLGILPYHNERSGLFINLFPSYQLGRDLKKVDRGEPLPNPGIYVAAINQFFNGNLDNCIEKTAQLMELLISNNYLNNPNSPDILSKCDKSTLSSYHKLILDIWNHYYTQYTSGNLDNIEVYSISQDTLDKIIQKYTKFRRPINLDFYQQRMPEIIELLKIKNPNALYTSIETEYVYFFKNVLENKSFYTLTREESIIFINTLYAFSDMLDKVHHIDSYRINLEILDFFNRIHDDNYNYISIDDIRKIQGCIYAISIETTSESIQGNLTLTSNNNLKRIESNYKPITYSAKLDMCDVALRNLLNNKILKKLDQYFEEATYISLYENRLQRGKDITPEEIKALYVLSLVYSNIAACTLQYIKLRININSKYSDYVDICETYHDRSRYIRCLIVRITQKMYNENSSDYKEALYFLATYYHSVATRYFYMKKYADSIAIRSVLYNFYTMLNLKEKARMQLELAPISLYEENGGNNQLYNNTTKLFFENHKKDFLYLYTTEKQSYDSFKELVNEYHNYKKFL